MTISAVLIVSSFFAVLPYERSYRIENLYFTTLNTFFWQFAIVFIIMLLVLKKLFNEYNRKFDLLCENVNEISSLKKYSRIYLKLCDLCQNISEYFGILTLGFSLAQFSQMCLQNYCAYVFIREPNLDHFKVNSFCFSWLIVITGSLYSTIVMSHTIKSEGKEISKILSKIPMSKLSKKARKNIEIFLLMLKHQQAEIISGIFIFDMKFVFDKMVYVLSFTIVFIQFYGFHG
jgi:hypothetical protein